MSHTKLIFVLQIACCTLFWSFMYDNFVESSKNTFAEQLTEENWDRMLTGEWMVEFYAPWCPACEALEPVWEHLASQKKRLNINVGKVDITDSPGLSGRFMVTALPTIYHVKDGVFRQYKSPRDKDSLIEFVSERTWEKIEPILGWKSPTSIQMSIISQFFKMSQVLRGVHNKLMEDFGLPTWGSYLIFAVVTIVLGAVLGLVIVCLIDLIYPPKPATLQNRKKQKDGSGGFMQEKTMQDEEIVENVKDDLVDEESEGEGSDAEEKVKDAGKDSKTEPSSPNVRKRKPRKADIMVNKSKKRSVSESEVAVKGKQEFVSKKKKSANGVVQNGQGVQEVKKEVKPQVKVEKKPGGEKKDKQSRAAFREQRKVARATNSNKLNRDIPIEELKKKIEAIENRENLSKTAKRKLSSLKKILGVKEGTSKPKPHIAKKQAQKGKNEKQVVTSNKKQVKETVEQKKKVSEKVEAKGSKDNKKTDVKQGSLLLVKQKKSDDDDDDDVEDDVDVNANSLSEDEDNSDVEEEESDENDSDVEEEEEDDENDSDVEEEEEDEEEEEEDDDEEVQEIKAKDAQSISKQNVEQGGKKKRFVLFVGNLPFTVTQEEIKKHFLTKASQIVDIRIPKTKENAPRGFAYVELGNQTDFEKAMSLNNSFVNGRRIKVQYSGSNKKETVAKNQKLQALQKAGKLAGGQKRNFQKKGGWKGGKPNTQKTMT
ncbi:uncharacterized protein LOC144475516 [Augochlora pura]